MTWLGIVCLATVGLAWLYVAARLITRAVIRSIQDKDKEA